MAFPLTETQHAILTFAVIATLGVMLIWAFWNLEQSKQKPKGRFSWQDYAGTPKAKVRVSAVHDRR